MRPRAIELHIESLVLHGFERLDGKGVAEAFRRELATILFQSAGAGWSEAEFAAPLVVAPPMALAAGLGGRRVGEALARAVGGALGSGEPSGGGGHA